MGNNHIHRKVKEGDPHPQQESVPMVVVSGEVWQLLNQHLLQIEDKLDAIKKRPQEFWMLEEDVAKFFGCSVKTVANWRSRGLLGHFRYANGKQILYDWQSVERFLKSNYHKAFQFES